MNVNSLDSLLERLNSGDEAAAQLAFVTYEPYLRKVVRRLLPAELRAKFDSIDVVQSIYCDVFSAFRGGGMRFANVAQLRAFLIKATKHRFIDRVRQYHSAAHREQPMSQSSGGFIASAREPRPSESAAAQELWDRLLELCPPEHHQLLWLRRRGASASEIAHQIGMHEGSVRRVLRQLSLRLACLPGAAQTAG